MGVANFNAARQSSSSLSAPSPSTTPFASWSTTLSLLPSTSPLLASASPFPSQSSTARNSPSYSPIALPAVEYPAESSMSGSDPSATTIDNIPTYAPAPSDATSRAWRPNPVYTFLATLVLLLAVSAAIVTRSFLLRRRNRLLVEEAIRNGTWVPGMFDGGVGGNGPMGRGGPRVDISKKPKMYETYLGAGAGDGLGEKDGGYGYGYGSGGAYTYHTEGRGFAGQGENAAWGGEMKEWDGIKPVSVAYVEKEGGRRGKEAGESLDGTQTLNNVQGSASPTHQQREGRGGPLRRAGTFIADLFRPPRPGTVSQSPAASPRQPEEDEESDRSSMVGSGESERSVRIAVLIAMPRPPSTVGRRHAGVGHSASSSEASSSSLTSGSASSGVLAERTVTTGSIGMMTTAMTHPLSAVPVLHRDRSAGVSGTGVGEEEEKLLPVLEIGVAEVVLVDLGDEERERAPRRSGDTEEEWRGMKEGDGRGRGSPTSSVER